MASVSSDRRNGSRFIQFQFGGERRTIRLGKVPKKMAEAFKLRIEFLIAASLTGQPIDQASSLWLANLDDVMYGRLAATGLVPERTSRSLHAWMTEYLDRRKIDLKPSSYKKLIQTQDKLKSYFKDDKYLNDLTPLDGENWRLWLKEQGLSEASVRTHCGNAKTILRAAVAMEIIERSPFAKLPSGNTPTRNTRYVTPDEAAQIVEACPNIQWKLLFGLARYAGLRTPSETHLLTWNEVDWDRARLFVRSPKTEHHPGHESREVPITPKLMPILREGAARTTGMKIVTIRGESNLRRRLLRIVNDAGVEPWDTIFQTLRRSCEIEWAQSFPQYAVSKWIGHSIVISGRHYANSIPDELFDRITNAGKQGDDSKSMQNPVQHRAARGRIEKNR